MSDPVGAAALVAVVCGVGGLLVPALIRAVPEPPQAEDEEAKTPYVEVAATPGLAGKSAVAAAACGALVGHSLGWAWPLLFLVPLIPVAVALTVIDWRTRLLPTRVIAPTYAVAVAGVLACWAITRDTDDLVRAGWGWLVAGGLFLLLWLVHPRGMGYGDVRLSGVLGIALGQLGWGPLLVGVYAGFLLGGVGGGLLSLLKVVERKAFPFGPFMLVGALVGIALGPELWSRLASG